MLHDEKNKLNIFTKFFFYLLVGITTKNLKTFLLYGIKFSWHYLTCLQSKNRQSNKTWKKIWDTGGGVRW